MSADIKEFHLFAGIGGGIYGGRLLGHSCCGGVEIDEYCQNILKQRMKDGCINEFPVYGDLCQLNGALYRGQFDVLCGGFPCQAFSTAAHGKNLPEKNLWGEMLRFARESDAPIVFGENVVYRAIDKAKLDLEAIGYSVKTCRLSCSDLGADHRRNRFWLLAVKDNAKFTTIKQQVQSLPKLSGAFWKNSAQENGASGKVTNRRRQLKGIGNAQSPFAAAIAFRILVNRFDHPENTDVSASDKEIASVFNVQPTWIKLHFGSKFGLVHTPTTMANYSAPSMQHHQGCHNFVQVFSKPSPDNAEYLMGFPIGASSEAPMNMDSFMRWIDSSKYADPGN